MKRWSVQISLFIMAVFCLTVCYAESTIDPAVISVDDIVTFGNYEQDNDLSNGPEAIEWIVLDVQDGKALLLSKYGLDVKLYNTGWTDITWETCTLRTWLNSDFKDTAFDRTEQRALLLTKTAESRWKSRLWNMRNFPVR